MSHSTDTTRSEPSFVRVAREHWLVSQSVEACRIQRLCNAPSYEAVVAHVGKNASILFHKRERARKEPDFFRVVVRLNADATAIDLFHNSASGYRAQYYHSCRLGIRANEFAVSQLAPVVLGLIAEHPKRTCPAWWVEKSLLDLHAKIWIRQGLWFRHAKVADRELLVKRWLDQQECQDPDRRKKAVWGSLIPERETQLEIKGGFLTLDGKPLGGLKPGRTKDLHELGFT